MNYTLAGDAKSDTHREYSMVTQTRDTHNVDTATDNEISLRDSVNEYIPTLPDKEKQETYPDLSSFIRWLGPERLVSSLLPSDIEQYSGTLGTATSDLHKRRVDSIRGFLTFLRKNEYIDENLAKHMRVKKPSVNSNRSSMARRRNASVKITEEGYREMVEQLEVLRVETLRIAEEIEKAAASGDVRENAPLEAARENQGMVQAQISRLESTIKSAEIIKEADRISTDVVQIGSWVELSKENSGDTMKYQVVAANEANPLSNKISDISPVGSAILGKKLEDEVKVKTPAGDQKFRIESIS